MKRYIAILITLLAANLALAQEQSATNNQTLPADLNAVWSSANTAYNEGDFAEAVELYESILSAGEHSAKVYYNLGNAYYKQEQLGKAILNYNRALRLAPYDEDIEHNLEYATAATKDQIESIPEFFLSRWMGAARNIMGSDGWAAASLVVLAVTLIAALIYLLAQTLSRRKAGFYVMCVGAVMFVVSAVFAYQSRQELIGGGEAVIMSSAVAIKSSPDRAATDLFVLHEGTRLSVGERIDGWAEIRIADGRKGWIEISRIEVI